MFSELEQKLQSKNITPTAMRLMVLEFFLKQEAANSLSNLENAFQNSDRTTLYRTLKTFEENGLIHPIQDGTGSTKYALCADTCTTGEHHDLHVHFYCNECKETFCLPRTHVPEMSLPKGFQPIEFNLIAKGTCDKCQSLQ